MDSKNHSRLLGSRRPFSQPFLCPLQHSPGHPPAIPTHIPCPGQHPTHSRPAAKCTHTASPCRPNPGPRQGHTALGASSRCPTAPEHLLVQASPHHDSGYPQRALPQGPDSMRPVSSKHTPCPRLAEPTPAGVHPCGLPGLGQPGQIPLTLFLHRSTCTSIFVTPLLEFLAISPSGRSLPCFGPPPPRPSACRARPHLPWGLGPRDHGDCVQLNEGARNPHGVVAPLELTKLN